MRTLDSGTYIQAYFMCKPAVLISRVIIKSVIPLIFIFRNSLNETIFQETDAATSMKEIRRRDPYGHIPFFFFCFGVFCFTWFSCKILVHWHLVLYLWARSFSLPEFVAEVQEVVKPVLNAYIKVGDKLIS